MSAHSPGPWRWTSSPADGDYSSGSRTEMLETADGAPVLNGHVDTPYDDDLPTVIAVSEADARLIAAAPELLEALEAVLTDAYGMCEGRASKAMARADELIARLSPPPPP